MTIWYANSFTIQFQLNGNSITCQQRKLEERQTGTPYTTRSCIFGWCQAAGWTIGDQRCPNEPMARELLFLYLLRLWRSLSQELLLLVDLACFLRAAEINWWRQSHDFSQQNIFLFTYFTVWRSVSLYFIVLYISNYIELYHFDLETVSAVGTIVFC